MMKFNQWPWRYWAQQHAHAIAIKDEEGTITWQQLVNDVDKLALIFHRQGVNQTSNVLLRDKNSYVLLKCYLAILQLGAKVLIINPQIPLKQLEQLSVNLSIDFVWSSSIDNLVWPSSVRQLSISMPLVTIISKAYCYANWLEERPATLILTSGSTGLPKAVVHSLCAHLASAESLLHCLPFEMNDCWLLSLPLFHISGQSIIWRWLVRGACLAIVTSNDLMAMLIGCSHASLVPTQLWRLLKQSIPSNRLKHVLLGGAMIPQQLIDQALAQGINCWCGYGLTEMSATVFVKRANGQPGSGCLLPQRELKIVDQQIYLRGAGLALGYWQNQQIISFTDEQGWFATRDRGEFFANDLIIRGRLDNAFFSGGEGIQPEDIERCLMNHAEIKQALILPIADDEFGHRPVAVIKATRPFTLDEINAWLKGKLSRYQFPIAIYELPDAFITGQVKLSRQKVSDWLMKTRQ